MFDWIAGVLSHSYLGVREDFHQPWHYGEHYSTRESTNLWSSLGPVSKAGLWVVFSLVWKDASLQNRISFFLLDGPKRSLSVWGLGFWYHKWWTERGELLVTRRISDIINRMRACSFMSTWNSSFTSMFRKIEFIRIQAYRISVQRIPVTVWATSDYTGQVRL